MMAFDDSSLDDYNDVASRLTELRDKYPDGRLRPADEAMPYHVVRIPCGWCVKCKGNRQIKGRGGWGDCPRCQGSGVRREDEPHEDVFIVYAAAALRDAGDAKPGIGMAWEPYPGRTPYTALSELQNAETSAWGRALQAAGIADARKGVASQEEIRNRAAERDEDGFPAGSKPATPAKPPAANGDVPTDTQRRRIFAQFNELGIKDADVQRVILGEILGREVSSRKGLTPADADKVYAELRKRPRPAKEPVTAA